MYRRDELGVAVKGSTLKTVRAICYALALLALPGFGVRSIALASPNIRPGDGYPGRMEKYEVTPELKRHLERFDLTAGWFRRDPLPPEKVYHFRPDYCPVNELPYLLFSPKRGRKPVPMVFYFGGTGEHGTNLVDQLSSTFTQRSPVKFLRVLPEPAKPEVLTLREIGVE